MQALCAALKTSHGQIAAASWLLGLHRTTRTSKLAEDGFWPGLG
jgi:hypothetical protein